MPRKIRVTVWGENIHERKNAIVREIYPRGMHTAIAEAIGEKREFNVRTATLQEPQHGLTKSLLNQTDVLVWWGHAAHGKVGDRAVERVLKRVWQGMGFIALHSSHYSKPFKRLMGTSCSLTWREAGEKERLWVCNPAHPIARGIDRYFEIPNTEMYGEPFAIPTPEEVVFISWFEGGEVFRSGCTWKRGNGKIFYFRPGHEVYPIYHHPVVGQVLRNAVRWAAPDAEKWIDACPQVPAKKAPEPLEAKRSAHAQGRRERFPMNDRDVARESIAKVPEVTLLFWIIKILATTLGETGGDAVTMSWLGETTPEATGTGYLIGTGIFGVIFVVAVLVQISAKTFHPFLYWVTIVATTTVGTTLADYCTRSLGIGYTGGSTILLFCVIASLVIWRCSAGSISIETVSTPKVEVFYWVTIMFSQTLGTALGDWVADTNDMGYLGAAAVFGGLLLLAALLYYFTSLSHAVSFWAAFILTRPFGAVVGDFLDKPHEKGGLELSRYTASLALLVVIVALILIFPQRPASKAH